MENNISCLYDNPATMKRELWIDGKLVKEIDSAVLSQENFDYEKMPTGHAIGFIFRWEKGKIHYGTKDAIYQDNQPTIAS